MVAIRGVQAGFQSDGVSCWTIPLLMLLVLKQHVSEDLPLNTLLDQTAEGDEGSAGEMPEEEESEHDAIHETMSDEDDDISKVTQPERLFDWGGTV